MVEPLLLGATIRLLVEIYHRFFAIKPCQHKHQMTQHSMGHNVCYDCRAKIYAKSDFPAHTR